MYANNFSLLDCAVPLVKLDDLTKICNCRIKTSKNPSMVRQIMMQQPEVDGKKVSFHKRGSGVSLTSKKEDLCITDLEQSTMTTDMQEDTIVDDGHGCMAIGNVQFSTLLSQHKHLAKFCYVICTLQGMHITHSMRDIFEK